MNETNRPILCARCNVGIQERIDPNGEAVGFCPICGQWDTLENVFSEAGDHMVDKMGDDLLSGFATANPPFVSVTVNQPPKRVYRFIMGDEPHSDTPS